MKINKRYIVLTTVIVILISAITLYNYMYKEHRNIATEKVDFKMNTHQLVNAMRTTDSAKILADKVILANGIITSIEQNSIILNNDVQVNFNQEDINKLSEATSITIKGRCVGYDDLLELVKIDQATIINN